MTLLHVERARHTTYLVNNAVQGSQQLVTHLVPRHGLSDVRQNQALHVLKLIL